MKIELHKKNVNFDNNNNKINVEEFCFYRSRENNMNIQEYKNYVFPLLKKIIKKDFLFIIEIYEIENGKKIFFWKEL